VIIDAWQWDESKASFADIGCRMGGCSGHVDRPDEMINLTIDVVSGARHVKKGDYIVKDVNGGFYVCSAEKFKNTYEAVQK